MFFKTVGLNKYMQGEMKASPEDILRTGFRSEESNQTRSPAFPLCFYPKLSPRFIIKLVIAMENPYLPIYPFLGHLPVLFYQPWAHPAYPLPSALAIPTN